MCVVEPHIVLTIDIDIGRGRDEATRTACGSAAAASAGVADADGPVGWLGGEGGLVGRANGGSQRKEILQVCCAAVARIGEDVEGPGGYRWPRGNCRD